MIPLVIRWFSRLIDLLQIILNAASEQKLDAILSITIRPFRNCIYIKERQIFAEIVIEIGIAPAEFAIDVYDFMVDNEIVVYSTIKYQNKTRGGWGCIIQLKDISDIQKVKERFPDGYITLPNGENLRITSCGTYLPKSFFEINCSAKEVKGIPPSRICKFFPQKFEIAPRDCVTVDKLFVVTCRSITDAIELTQTPLALPNKHLQFRYSITDDAESRPKGKAQSSAIIPYRRDEFSSPSKGIISFQENMIIRSLNNRVDALENNQNVLAASVVKVSKGLAILNNAILDVYATLDSHAVLQQVSSSITDFQLQLTEAYLAKDFTKVEEITSNLKKLQIARNGQGTIVEMRSSINKSHFEEVINAQQTLTNELREGVSSIEDGSAVASENSNDSPEEKAELVEIQDDTVQTPDSGKKRSINAGNSCKKQKTKKNGRDRKSVV